MNQLIDIEDYRERGWIGTQRHPTLPLTVCKYTRQFQAAGSWTDVMLGMRGAVYDDTGIKVNMPIHKFFNSGEVDDPTAPFRIFDKLDGTCIVTFLWQGEPIVHTLGSFISQQAKDARSWVERRFGWDWMRNGYTYVFEWMDPENFTTLRWKHDPQLTLLFVGGPDGEDRGNSDWPGITVAERDLSGTVDLLRQHVADDEEGFVLVYDERHLGQHRRLKVKGERYLALHRMVWNLSESTVWDMLYQSSPADRELFRATIDEEARMWFDTVAARMEHEVAAIRDEANARFAPVRDMTETRDKATYITTQPEHLRPYLFLLMNGKPGGDSFLAKLVRPRGHTTYAPGLDDAA